MPESPLCSSFRSIRQWEPVCSNGTSCMFKSSSAGTDGQSYAVIVYWHTILINKDFQRVLDPSLGFDYLLFSIWHTHTHTHTHTHSQRPLESVSKAWGQGLRTTLGWSVHPLQRCAFLCSSNTTVTCCGSGQLSLPSHVQQKATSLSELWWRKWNPPGSFHPAREWETRGTQRRDVTRALAAALLKNIAELSAQLQFYHISVPRHLSNGWHVLHPPQFVHFHQPEIAHEAFFSAAVSFLASLGWYDIASEWLPWDSY